MKWLQLSDLHIKENSQWEMMKTSYKNILSNEQIDFMVITGDLHDFGDDYSKTTEFLDEIINITKIEKESLFIIPGNHDSQYFRNKEALISKILLDLPSDSESYKKYQSDLKESFAEYTDFYKKYFDMDNYLLEDVRVRTWKEKINIVELNSALISDGDDHCQIIDIYGLSRVKLDNNFPTIVIGHHELGCLCTEHKDSIYRIFTELNVAAYLCGDSHKNSTSYIVNYTSSNLVIPGIVCGKSAIDNKDTFSDNSFILYDSLSNPEDEVVVHLYEWDAKKKYFVESTSFDNDNGKYKFKLYPSGKKQSEQDKVVKTEKVCIENRFDTILRLKGYELIYPRGEDGIKYLWEKNGKIVESLTFNNRYKSENISAYTASLSHGCILNVDKTQCLFCGTGKNEFKGYLTAEDIALQNIFMASYDADCSSHPQLKENSREFAYMGQGEAGHAYHLIRKAIKLTDCAMDLINQKVHRHIISTCGITGFIPLLIKDIESGFLKKEVCLHFSLNAIGRDRDILMPINKDYDFRAFIHECELYFKLTQKKVTVSIIMFNNLVFDNVGLTYTLTIEKLNEILTFLNPDIFRIDLRDFYPNSAVSTRPDRARNELALNLVYASERKGFEASITKCFGLDEKMAFGMLESSMKNMDDPGTPTIARYNNAVKLLKIVDAKIVLNKI